MKRNNFLWSLLFIGFATFVFCSCSNDDDDLKTDSIPSTIVEQLNVMYPEMAAHWEMERGQYKAEFIKDGKDYDVYFQQNGTWVMTIVDVLYNDLPQAVKDYLAANYSDYRVDDVDWVEKPDARYYHVELEKKGAADVHLNITAEGQVVN